MTMVGGVEEDVCGEAPHDRLFERLVDHADTEAWERGGDAESVELMVANDQSPQMRRAHRVQHMHSLFLELDTQKWADGVGSDEATIAHAVHMIRDVEDVAHTPLIDQSFGDTTPPLKEPLLKVRSRKSLKRKLLRDEMIVLQHQENIRCQVVYDVDDPSVARRVAGRDVLQFESRFESGNLRTATQIHNTQYDLVLSPDINTNGHTQWFFFSVSGMRAGVTYRFNVVNLEKSNSQFNFGMQPVVFSQHEADEFGLGWHRSGTRVGYFKNNYCRQHPRKTVHYTATFSLTCKFERDTMYVAYHFPFTYSDMQVHLSHLVRAGGLRIRRDLLCYTLGGNRCELLTITEACDESLGGTVPIEDRPYIVLSARVHPGESNSSWVMKGALDFLISDDSDAVALRRRFVFKVVPMLNPDGVANGNHRCSLAGQDLNRQWRTAHPVLHPTIASTKLLFEYLATRGITPAVYCDFHGHSRKKMIFIYGCAETKEVRWLPRSLAEHAPQFSWKSTRFGITSDKDGSARVVVMREFGVNRSYTMEATFCGYDKGEFRGEHVSTRHLEDMGAAFVKRLLELDIDDGSPAL